eukprot:jgi/Chlat1/2170/Chrsp17S02851
MQRRLMLRMTETMSLMMLVSAASAQPSPTLAAAAAAGQFKSLKLLKEEFVSGLSGTTLWEISEVISIAAVAVLFRNTLVQYISRVLKKPVSVDSWGCVVLDSLLILLPMLLSMTVTELTRPLLLLMMAGSTAMLAVAYWKGTNLLRPSAEARALLASPYKNFMTLYRGAMMLNTCIAILAVDFHVFPRRFAKAETYGTGLMDVGVGSFVLAGAITSREARNLPPVKRTAALQSVLPLLALGLVRLIMTKGVDYQEHVTEYGVHWNFFFTLAAVSLLTAVLRFPSAVCGAAVHQFVLSGTFLGEYLMSAERGQSIWSKNKEGIGSALGKDGGNHPSENASTGSWWLWLCKLWLLDACFWLALLLARQSIEPVSRRTCNLSYVLWILAFNTQLLASFATVDVLLGPMSVRVLKAINDNQLFVFLSANVLTGLVNMAVDTLAAPETAALLILGAYIAVIVAGALWRTRNKGAALKSS